MRLYKRKVSPKWWATWNDKNGVRHRRSTRTEDRQLAQRLAAEWVKEDFEQAHFGKVPEVRFQEVLFRYAKVQKRKNPEGYERSTKYRLQLLLDWFGRFNVSEIASSLIQEYAEERLDEVSEGTVKRELGTLTAILRKAYREQKLATLPVFPSIKASKARLRWLTEQEVQTLRNEAAPHLRPIILVAVDTGARRGELLKLDWRQVNLADKLVTFLDTKNGEDRGVPLCDRACAVLTSLGPKERGPVFTFRGKPVMDVKTAFNKARTKAGLDDVCFHTLRHSLASRLVQGGVPLYDVMHWLGHKSLEMVQRYAHLAPDYQDRALNVLNVSEHKMGTPATLKVA